MKRLNRKTLKEVPEELVGIPPVFFQIGTSLDLVKEIDAFLRGLSEELFCACAAVYVLRDGDLVLGGSYGLSARERRQEAESAFRSPLLHEAVSTRKTINFNDQKLERYQVQLAAPMSLQDKIMGVLWLARTGPRPFSDKEIRMIAFLLERFSLSTDRALLYDELETKNRHLHKLYGQVIKAKADWQNTFDSISDLVCILDKDARITRVNRAFRDRLERPYETLIGAYCYSVVHGTSDLPRACPLRGVLETGHPVQCEAETLIGDSPFAVTIYPFFDSAGTIQGTIHIYRDISEQKMLKDKLIQSQKMAAIGTMAAELAHEINNPLDYIGNYLYLLSESLPPDFAGSEYLKKIETGINNLAALTRDLLEFSGPQIGEFAPLDMHFVIEGALDFISSSLREKRVKVVKDFRCRDYKVMGSPRMLQQVLLNLILNSLDAMLSGGTISIATSSRQGRFLMEFSDTGIGIPEASLTRIFDPFFTTKKASGKKGTGLGLTICYNIVIQHKGDISVASKEGEGTRFTVILPAVKA